VWLLRYVNIPTINALSTAALRCSVPIQKRLALVFRCFPFKRKTTENKLNTDATFRSHKHDVWCEGIVCVVFVIIYFSYIYN